MTPETIFYNWLRAHWTYADIWRIESTTGSGIPDCHVTVGTGKDFDTENSFEFWLELKACPSGNVQLRKNQYARCMRKAQVGGKVILMNRDPKTKIIQTWIFPFKVEPGRLDHVRIVDKSVGNPPGIPAHS